MQGVISGAGELIRATLGDQDEARSGIGVVRFPFARAMVEMESNQLLQGRVPLSVLKVVREEDAACLQRRMAGLDMVEKSELQACRQLVTRDLPSPGDECPFEELGVVRFGNREKMKELLETDDV